MRISQLAALPLAASLLLSAASLAAAAKRADFTPFFGNYKGTTIVTLGSDGASGSALFHVTGPKNGHSATVNFTGTLISGGTLIPLSNQLRFFGKHGFTSQSLIFNLNGIPTPATGTYKASKHTIRFTAPWAISGQTGIILGTLRLGGRQLTLNYQVHITGDPDFYNFTFRTTRKGK